MSASDIQATSSSPPPAPAPRPQADPGLSFHDLLSVLNPLQYLPVVGTIYRAVTGDVIPDSVRYAGSMAVSGLLGGPIGLVSNIALLIGQKVTGIDPEKIVAGLFHSTSQAPTQQQLAAYGVSPDSSMHRSDVEGADLGNEPAKIVRAAAAYAANQMVGAQHG